MKCHASHLAQVCARARLGQAHERLQLARRDWRAALRRARLRAQVQVEAAQHLPPSACRFLRCWLPDATGEVKALTRANHLSIFKI